MTQKDKTLEEIVVPARIGVFDDKKGRARTVAFPFTFPDGTNGVIMVSRLNPGPWVPADTISMLTIHYTTKP